MILESIKPIVKDLVRVRINEQKVEGFVEKNLETVFNPSPGPNLAIYPEGLSWEEWIDFYCLYSSQAFRFWPNKEEERWGVLGPNKEWLYGSEAMFWCLTQALKKGLPILRGSFWADLDLRELEELLRGKGEIPKKEMRSTIFKEIGRGLVQNFDGHFYNLFTKAQGGGIKFVKLLAENFPCFRDEIIFNGKLVKFYKKAQLAAHLLWRHWWKKTGGQSLFKDVNQLTLCADYKIPQPLRHLRILEYNQHLSSLVDNQIPIKKDSQEEIEIRAATIWAGHLIVKEFQQRGRPEINCVHLDAYLWRTTKKVPNMKPHHLTDTICY